MIIKVKDAKNIWYLKYQIESPQKVFGKVFKCSRINVFGILLKYQFLSI